MKTFTRRLICLPMPPLNSKFDNGGAAQPSLKLNEANTFGTIESQEIGFYIPIPEEPNHG